MQQIANAKIILFGEWAVLENAPCTGLTLNSQFFLDAHPSDTTKLIGETKNLSQDKWFTNSLLAIQDYLNCEQTFTFTTKCQWRSTEGLGISSALFLTLYRHFAKETMTQLIWNDIYSCFRNVKENYGSGADLAIQFHDKPCIYTKGQEPIDLEAFNWPKELYLIHGPGKLLSNQIVKKLKLKNGPINKIKQSSEQFIVDRDWEKAIHTHRQSLDELGVIDPRMKIFEEKLQSRSKEALVKSVGAGGLDALLVWSPDRNALDKTIDEMKFDGWYHSPYTPN